MLVMLIRDGLLATGVLFAPALIIAAVVCSLAAWQPGTEPGATLELLGAGFVFACWALWGFVSGPERLRLWWFGLVSLLNLLMGVGVATNGKPHAVKIGLVFLACSLAQFFIFRRRWTYRRYDDAA